MRYACKPLSDWEITTVLQHREDTYNGQVELRLDSREAPAIVFWQFDDNNDGRVRLLGLGLDCEERPERCAEPFLRGDCNDDAALDLADPVANLAYQFLGNVRSCLAALDFDDNGHIEITDPIASLTHQFLGGPPPAQPGKSACGVDPTDDDLTCERFSTCEVNG